MRVTKISSIFFFLSFSSSFRFFFFQFYFKTHLCIKLCTLNLSHFFPLCCSIGIFKSIIYFLSLVIHINNPHLKSFSLSLSHSIWNCWLHVIYLKIVFNLFIWSERKKRSEMGKYKTNYLDVFASKSPFLFIVLSLIIGTLFGHMRRKT